MCRASPCRLTCSNRVCHRTSPIDSWLLSECSEDGRCLGCSLQGCSGTSMCRHKPLFRSERIALGWTLPSLDRLPPQLPLSSPLSHDQTQQFSGPPNTPLMYIMYMRGLHHTLVLPSHPPSPGVPPPRLRYQAKSKRAGSTKGGDHDNRSAQNGTLETVDCCGRCFWLQVSVSGKAGAEPLFCLHLRPCRPPFSSSSVSDPGPCRRLW